MGDRILVVDDDPDILQYVKMNLELEGFETETASNGIEALQVARRRPPALVLMDVMMPGMDGLTALRHLRNDPTTSSVPVVMLTARALAKDRVKGLDLGADDYITKPFAVEELVARVGTVIRRAQQMRDVSPLTGLPGNFRIAGELEHRIEARPRSRSSTATWTTSRRSTITTGSCVATRDQVHRHHADGGSSGLRRPRRLRGPCRRGRLHRSDESRSGRSVLHQRHSDALTTESSTSTTPQMLSRATSRSPTAAGSATHSRSCRSRWAWSRTSTGPLPRNGRHRRSPPR